MQQPASSSAEIVRIPVSAEARLLAALRMLETRLAEQRTAVAAWRDEIGRLSALLQTVGTGAQAVQQDLGVMAADLDRSRSLCLETAAGLDAGRLRGAEQ
ncbi:hypothetical protein [Lichenicoccus sp.]|uniref:hypothetical protein n=1 Tax=Lichenicoccus sp. TaxID=2781899 RepID=UPI003D0FAA2D